MDYLNSYNDICNGINIHETIINTMIDEINIIKKMMFQGAPSDINAISYSGLPSGNFSPMSLDRLTKRIEILKNRLDLEKATLKKLMEQKEEIESKVNKLEGLKHKVARMRFIEGRLLADIADELGYSIDRIKQVSAEISRELKE